MCILLLSSFQQLEFFVGFGYGTLHTLRHEGPKEVKVIITTDNALQDNLIYFLWHFSCKEQNPHIQHIENNHSHNMFIPMSIFGTHQPVTGAVGRLLGLL